MAHAMALHILVCRCVANPGGAQPVEGVFKDMTRYLSAYAAVLVVLLALDMLWLGVIARSYYQQAIGHLLAERPSIAVGLLYYLVYATGLMVFAVKPTSTAIGVNATLLAGAMFGAFAYATYDLTNLATLKGWPAGLSVLDIAWGSTISAASAAAGKVVMDRFGTS